MKKFLLSIFCCLMALASVQAQKTVTGNAKENFGSSTVNSISEFKVDPVTLTFAKNDGATAPAYNKAGDCRIYAKGSITANCTAGNLTKIVFTVSAQGKKRLTDLTPSVGTVTIADDHSTITWEGNAAEVVMTVGEKAVYGTDGSEKAGQICFTDFEATFSTDGGSTPDPEEPEGGEGEEGDENEGEVTYSTIAEVIAAGAGEAATKGTVIATYARGFLMNDGTGSILVYQGNSPAVTTAEGDVVNVSGTTSMYGGLLQFAAGSAVEKTGTATVTHPTVTVMDGAAMDAFLAAPAVKYIEYTGTLTISGNYYNVAVEGAATAIGSIQYPKDGVVTATSGAVVKVTGYAIGVSSSKYVNTMAVKVEVIEEGEEPEEPETPAETKEYTVTEALAAFVSGQQIPAIVKGYIVGSIDDKSISDANFSGTAVLKTNLLIADNADETDIEKCLPVQLPSGAVREALNLVDTPDNYKKEVVLTGSLEKYFGVAGLKSVSAYEFTGVTGINEVKGENGNVKTIYDLTGRRVETITVPGIYIVGGKKVLVK